MLKELTFNGLVTSYSPPNKTHTTWGQWLGGGGGGAVGGIQKREGKNISLIPTIKTIQLSKRRKNKKQMQTAMVQDPGVWSKATSQHCSLHTHMKATEI